MQKDIKKYIENNIVLIDSHNWEEFFKDAPEGTGEFLYNTGIDFMGQMKRVPSHGFLRSSLTDITIPNGVTSIGMYAFYGCSSLTNIVIPDSVTNIDEGVFYDCTNLTSIIIPDSVTSIGNYAFIYCESLTSITIPSNVKSIGRGTFSSCSSLTSIVIPDSVTSIGYQAFYYCNKLTDIHFGGTTAEWQVIEKKLSWQFTIDGYFTVHCTDGDLIKRKR